MMLHVHVNSMDQWIYIKKYFNFTICSFTWLQDPERLKTLGYHEKMEEITARIGGRFLDYRPETGSWVFEVLWERNFQILL